MTFVIILAGLMVGVSTYLVEDGAYELPFGRLPTTISDAIEFAILILFIAECAIKIFADPLRLWVYFVGESASWNLFDFVIVVLCLPFIDLPFAAGNTC